MRGTDIFRSKTFYIGIIVLGLGLVVAAAFLLLSPKKPQYSAEASKKALALLTDSVETQDFQTITSNFGFSVQYEATTTKAEGIVQNKTSAQGMVEGNSYSEKELDETRDYGIVNLRFREEEKKEPKKDAAGMPEYTPARSYMSVVTNRRKDYFAGINEVPGYEKLSHLGALVKKKRDDMAKDYPNVEISESTTKINNIEYTVLTLKHYFSALGDERVLRSTDYVYMTVQNDRPYWISIYDVRERLKEDVELWRSVLGSVEYQEPNSESLVFKHADAMLAAAKKTDTAYIRGSIDASAMINVVARNQLASVRVGSMRCMDIRYEVSGHVLTLNDTCSGGEGSGSIISNDGTVATNGHVTLIAPDEVLASANPSTQEEWDAYSAFIVNAGYVSRAQMEQLYAQAAAGNQEALEQLLSYLQYVPKSSITTSNDRRTFVIQTSDEPMRANDTLTRWVYTSTNKAATLIDEEVNASQTYFNSSSPLSDVALLKMEGSYPAVRLSSLSAVSSTEPFFAIGYPQAVDGGTQTSAARTIPTVSAGIVTSKIEVAGGNTIVQTTAQISGGNSGGPAFNARGDQIGLNTYGAQSGVCDTQTGDIDGCFGGSIARDAYDITEMTQKNSITIPSSNELMELWRKGLDEFLQGRYSRARETFAMLDGRYPSNYLVAKFLASAKEQRNDDVSGITTTDDESGELASLGEDSDIAYLSEYYSEGLGSDEDDVALAVGLGAVGVLMVVAIVVAIALATRSTKANARVSNTPNFPVQQVPVQGSVQLSMSPPLASAPANPTVSQPQYPAPITPPSPMPYAPPGNPAASYPQAPPQQPTASPYPPMQPPAPQPPIYPQPSAVQPQATPDPSQYVPQPSAQQPIPQEQPQPPTYPN